MRILRRTLAAQEGAGRSMMAAGARPALHEPGRPWPVQVQVSWAHLPERAADSRDPGRDLPAKGLMTLIGFKAAWLKGAGAKSANGRQRSSGD